MLIIFIISVSFLIYHLVGYGLLLSFFNLFKKPIAEVEISDYPTITVLCPAFNEEDIIEEKIHSFLDLDYPKDKIDMIVISDDSTDRTHEIVNRYTEKNNIRLVIQKSRKGKQSGHNLVEPGIKSDYVLSTDANSIFQRDAAKELVRTMLSDENICMVSGVLKLVSENNQDSGEGLYWQYESWLKKLESKFYSIIGSNGSIYLIKREYFTQIHPASVDDFERTLHVIKQNKITKYNQKAVVVEKVTGKAVDEIGRKIRIITQQLFCLQRNISVLNFTKNFKIAFILISHKIIRWLLPVFSLLMLISNIFLFNFMLFKFILLGQILIYILGLVELIMEKKGEGYRILKLFAYFIAMNYSAIVAFIDFLKGKQYATWDIIRK